MPQRSSVLKLSSAQRELQRLQNEVVHLSDPEAFARSLAQMREQLGELEVAYEELEAQNEELEATREALERERHRYRHLFDEAPFGYLVTDVHGVVEEVNRAAAELFAVSQDLLPGKPVGVYLDSEDRRSFRALLSRARAGEPGGELEARIKPRNREPFAVVLNAVRDLDDRTQTARLRWTVRDVSATKQAEEALRESEERLRHSQRLEAVGRLAGGIAHSFNNLLAAISFQCELLGEEMAAEDARRAHVDEIQRSGERAASLARQLLAYGRKQVLQPRVLHLGRVIGEMAPVLRRLIGEHIGLETRLEPAGAVYADLGQLEQVILNLTVNARDAMPAGGVLRIAVQGVELAAGEAAELPAGPYVQLTVEDTGGGIEPEVMPHLFEPFFTTKERGKGTGLGLATIHGIVHQSGGRIRVESEPGLGARFVILLPQALEGAETFPPKPATLPGRAARRGTEVVLLVEDEDNIRQPAVEILEARGYQVLAAADAAQALAVADSHPEEIHILVTDVVMPGLSGSQLARRLLRQRPGIQVLYISGYPEDSISHHGVLDAGQHFLQKPFPPGQFLEKVREVLDARVEA